MNPNAPDTLGEPYFDYVYAQRADPWNFTTSAYEAAKYQATVDALPRPTYPNALEIGCSLGVLTRKLAARCGRLLAVDLNDNALQQARERCADVPNVRIEKLNIPAQYPGELFDITVLSEVGYYWNADDLRVAQDAIATHMATGGQLILVHWTPPVHDYPLTGDDVHNAFATRAEELALAHVTGFRADTYRLDIWEKR